MTSQIVLFNGSGVAIASDSAQTAGGSVVDTAEKIFPSPEPHQIAVITSNSAFFHGYPIDTLIAEWYATLGSKRLPTAKSYSDAFVRFLNTSGLFSDEWQTSFVYRCFEDLLHQVAQVADEDSGGKSEVDIVAAATKMHSQFNMPNLDGADERWVAALLDTILTWDRLRHWCTIRWPEYWVGPSGTEPAVVEQDELEAIRELLVVYLSRSLWWHNRTDLAIVGYGEHEVMPSFFHRDLRAHICGKTLGRVQQEQKFDSSELERYVGYQPLAQSDAIDSFVRGFASEIFSAAKGELEVSLDSVLSKGDAAKDQLIAEMRSQSVEVLKRVFSEKDRLEVFKTTISHLPVASLAAVAQALIQVQALSVLLKGDLRTVGGPIDTAIISRGSGFVWMQHKSASLGGSALSS